MILAQTTANTNDFLPLLAFAAILVAVSARLWFRAARPSVDDEGQPVESISDARFFLLLAGGLAVFLGLNILTIEGNSDLPGVVPITILTAVAGAAAIITVMFVKSAERSKVSELVAAHMYEKRWHQAQAEGVAAAREHLISQQFDVLLRSNAPPAGAIRGEVK